MTTITLKNGYYIEIDPLNYTHFGRSIPEKQSQARKEMLFVHSDTSGTWRVQ